MTTHRGIELEYACDRSALAPALADAFVELAADASTRAWVDDALDRPQSRATTALRDLAKQFVGFYDANAIAGAFRMRMLGADQWVALTGKASGRLLDVGAGDGHVTAEVAALYDQVVTTELSAAMARLLRKRGWTCHEIDLAVDALPAGEAPFDAITLLNVLDRTSFPLALLGRLPPLLAAGGCLVIAVPLPLSQVVLERPNAVDPLEPLPKVDGGWEAGANALWADVLAPLGFGLHAVSRVPYLCRGDARRPIEVLDDVVFVCERP